MTLFLAADALAARRALLREPQALGGLALSLQRELHAALDVPVPEGKSRLTRHGGRCVTCTVLLAFDPRSPHAHTCPQCGTVYTDGVHHEWWLMNGHLWTAEQCTRAAALAYLCGDEGAAARADDILACYTERYLQWPNRDNALGPTRPFFSTYLESIWLLHLATALDLRAAAGGDASLRAAALDRLVTPSAALIASFDEGRSNRQVWHAAALLAASGLLADHAMRDRAAASLVALLRDGLHTDGSWYEGENYHLFAHRGLLSAVTLAERAGVELPRDLLQRFEDGFAVPFRTMLPDGTFPSRRDSQYGVSLRQYRTADWVECGLARRDTPALRAALAMMYEPAATPGDTGRAYSTADAERNQRGVRLTRADCSWRALLLARAELPPLADAEPRSELLEGQGLAVFRRKHGTMWVGLDYGDPGDGHGHPDRLNLVIATSTHRWLDDVGTGSYTSPTLAWYRSSMAHNSPFVNGTSQGEARGTLLAHDEQGDMGWVTATFTDPTSGVAFTRTVVVCGDHLLDELTWRAPAPVQVDVPMQAARVAAPTGDTWSPFTPDTAMDAWLAAPVITRLAAGDAHALVLAALPSPALPASGTRRELPWALWTSTDAELWAAGTIGPPAGQASGLVALRQHGTEGRSVRAVALRGVPVSLSADETACVVSINARRVRHQRTATGWSITALASGDVLHLGGLREATVAPRAAARATAELRHRIICSDDGRGRMRTTLVLGEASYRGTEVPWAEADRPTAELTFATLDAAAEHIAITADVRLCRAPRFAPAVDDNPLDNEHPDTNSDGVQLHWRSPLDGTWNSLLTVPEPGGAAVRLSAIGGSADGVTASYELTGAGYRLTLVLPWPGPDHPLVCDVVLNEMPVGRERRRGQLVLSGARGESAYLRGARQDPGRAVTILFQSPLT